MNNYQTTEKYIPKNEKEKRLCQAFAKLKGEKEIARFLRDLLTVKEIEEFSNRLEIARLLLEKKPYAEIAHEVKTSTTTVTRVAYWLFQGCGGYKKVL